MRILLLVLFSLNVWAQPADYNQSQEVLEEKSRWEFGLGLNMIVDSNRGFVVDVNPSAQYFVYKNLSVGGFLQFYSDDFVKFYSVCPSATYFLLRSQPYSIVFNQRIRFRQYLKPDNIDAAGTVSLTTLAVEYVVQGGLAARLGVGYKRSFDGTPLNSDSDAVDEWVFPTFGVAFYL